MILTLTPEEQELLLRILENYLNDLRFEIARTDSRRFKTQLRDREQIVRGFIERLGSA